MNKENANKIIAKFMNNECDACGGDGKETCQNPDHGFISAMPGDIGRLGCPVCGHDENHKILDGGDCEECDGDGSLIRYFKSLDSLVPVWEGLGVEYSKFYPQGYPKIKFILSTHINQDETKSWIGNGASLQEAAAIATAKMIEELNGTL